MDVRGGEGVNGSVLTPFTNRRGAGGVGERRGSVGRIERLMLISEERDIPSLSLFQFLGVLSYCRHLGVDRTHECH